MAKCSGCESSDATGSLNGYAACDRIPNARAPLGRATLVANTAAVYTHNRESEGVLRRAASKVEAMLPPCAPDAGRRVSASDEGCKNGKNAMYMHNIDTAV
jgi:hypothetical protein